MIDVDYLKRNADLLDLAENDTALKRVANTGGGEWAGPCPFCGGTDRFRVQPNGANGGRWMCRKCTDGRWGDVIGYVMARDKCDFREACERLGARETQMTTHHKPALVPQRTALVGPPPESWQAKAKAVIEVCQASLWSNAGARAREWLHSRGLTDETLLRWKIGVCAGPHTAWHKIAGLSVPCGIVIPCEVDGVVWYIKTRRAAGSPKYQQVKGGRPAMFGAQTLHGHKVAVICEGEFDALLLTQEAEDLCGVATLGSASNGLDILTWGTYLLPVASLLIAYDTDGAGKSGAAKISNLTARARRVTVPAIRTGDKDITDFHNAGGNLRNWVAFELTRVDASSRALATHSAGQTMPAPLPNLAVDARPNVNTSAAQSINGQATGDSDLTSNWQHSANAASAPTVSALPTAAPTVPVLPVVIPIDEWPEYKAQHKLTVAGCVWPEGAITPILYVDGSAAYDATSETSTFSVAVDEASAVTANSAPINGLPHHENILSPKEALPR